MNEITEIDPTGLFEETFFELTCPDCKRTDRDEHFDIVMACGDNVFCPHCNCEFDAITGERHDASDCGECLNRKDD